MNRYLFFGGPGIGDTVIELVAAKSLKTADPDCVIDLLYSASTGADKVISEVLKYQSFIEKSYCYSKQNKWLTIKVLIQLRKKKYKYSFACSTSFKSNSKPSIISKIIGTNSVIKKVEGKTGIIDIPVVVDENLHIVEQYFKLLNKVNLYTPVDGNVLDTNKLDHFGLNNKMGRIVVTICLGTNNTIFYRNGNPIHINIKEWPIVKWLKTAELLAAQGIHVVLIGGKKEGDAFKETNQSYNTNTEIEILIGKTTVGQSLSILSQSNLVVGADTGMMHCAAALGKRTLTLFGGTDYNIWKPYSNKSFVVSSKIECSPCYGKDYAISCSERKCLNVISVNEIIAKINVLLNDSNN